MNVGSLGFLCLLSALVTSLGSFSQIHHSWQRRSTNGLSLPDSEIRIYGKIPWILYSFCLSAIDPWIFSISVFNILLNLVVLGQFVRYSTINSREPLVRAMLAAATFSGALLVITFHRDLLQNSIHFFSWLPLLSTVILLPLATHSQFRLNKSGCGLNAVPLSRYVAYGLANLLSFSYGVAKAGETGWESSWTICAVAAYGLLLNGILVAQLIVKQNVHADSGLVPARA